MRNQPPGGDGRSGSNVYLLRNFLECDDLELEFILITHRHADRAGAAAGLAGATVTRLKEHKAIVAAPADQGPVAAGERMREHLRHGSQYVRQQIDGSTGAEASRVQQG